MTGTGIAGAVDYQPATPGGPAVCCACGVTLDGNTKGSPAARAVPGLGIIQACSAPCAASPAFRDAVSPAEAALRAEVEALRLAIQAGEDAPGHASSIPLAAILDNARRLHATALMVDPGWQPIATAPRDGSRFLAWFPPCPQLPQGGWHEAQWAVSMGGWNHPFFVEPVLWRRPPPAPITGF